eukprot:TRINITY_DN12_c0_g1_i2.p1 TRINITY_DN12_c0_g1~~TRINITY_DN12_c0_g1_i2.p1  ORF type:complete len:948 (-),score=297.23 TRINITY_DN12_c0_g1_i2:117-2960(-)
MAPKKNNKAAGAAAAEPEAKKAKTVEEEKKPEVAAKTEPEEKEVDAKDDKRAKIKAPIAFDSSDSTLNVVPTIDGRVLTCLNDAGMHYLVAGARANVGAKAGRYLYEVRIVETLDRVEEKQWTEGRPPSKHMVRVGFSTKGASLVLGDKDTEAFFFEPETGYFEADGKRQSSDALKCHRDAIVGVLLNLDSKSPNYNTVSLFKNGVRCGQPFAIPEKLHGKTLYPHVAFRNVSLQVHFGPEALKPLPFKCRSFQDAASADVEVTKAAVAKDGKHEVLFPVGLPDEGAFEWADRFLAKNPDYVELSDRKIVDWAVRSGLQKKRSGPYMDRPSNNFGLPMLDDLNIRKVINSVAAIVPRNYVVMTLGHNLHKEGRKKNLKQFPSFSFKRVASVVMGEPDQEHRKLVKSKILKDKQQKSDAMWRLKKVEKDRQKLLEARKKEAEEAKKKAEEQKKAEEEAKKKADGEEAKEKADGDVAAESTEKKDDKMETDEPAKEETKPADEEPEETEPPQVTLTDEEEAIKHVKGSMPDVHPKFFEKNFMDFSIPEKSEGFDDVKFEWDNQEASTAYLRQLILEKKRTSRIEDLQPGEWFKAQQTEWVKKTKEWQDKQKAAKAKAGSKKKKADDDENAVDLFSVEDISNIGGDEPLFLDFENEDWALTTLRWQLYTLAEAYRRDVNDPDRTQIPLVHVPFYFSKYFKNQLNPSLYGQDKLENLIGMVKDTMKVDGENLAAELSAEKAESVDYFVKLAEENRRQRQRRLDAGDETARLKLSPTLWGVVTKPPVAPKPAAETKPPPASAKPATTPPPAAGAKPPTPPAPPAPPAGQAQKVVAPPAPKGGKSDSAKGADKGGKGGKNDKGSKGDKGGKSGKDSYGKDSYGKDSYGKDSKGKDSYGKDGYGKDGGYGKQSYGKDGGYGKDGYGKDSYGKDGYGKGGYGKGGYGKSGGKKGW